MPESLKASALSLSQSQRLASACSRAGNWKSRISILTIGLVSLLKHLRTAYTSAKVQQDTHRQIFEYSDCLTCFHVLPATGAATSLRAEGKILMSTGQDSLLQRNRIAQEALAHKLVKVIYIWASDHFQTSLLLQLLQTAPTLHTGRRRQGGSMRRIMHHCLKCWILKASNFLCWKVSPPCPPATDPFELLKLSK